MTYTFVPKPSSLNYTNVNVQGKEQYDQASLTYDDINTFYNGTNFNMWTDVPKPTGGNSRKAGMATGLIIPPTYSTGHVAETWIKVAKPT